MLLSLRLQDLFRRVLDHSFASHLLEIRAVGKIDLLTDGSRGVKSTVSPLI